MSGRSVIEWCRNGALHIHDVVVAERIELLGRHVGFHVRRNEVEHFGREATGDAHFFDVLGGFKRNVHDFISIQKTSVKYSGARRETLCDAPDFYKIFDSFQGFGL